MYKHRHTTIDAGGENEIEANQRSMRLCNNRCRVYHQKARPAPLLPKQGHAASSPRRNHRRFLEISQRLQRCHRLQGSEVTATLTGGERSGKSALGIDHAAQGQGHARTERTRGAPSRFPDELYPGVRLSWAVAFMVSLDEPPFESRLCQHRRDHGLHLHGYLDSY